MEGFKSIIYVPCLFLLISSAYIKIVEANSKKWLRINMVINKNIKIIFSTIIWSNNLTNKARLYFLKCSFDILYCFYLQIKNIKKLYSYENFWENLKENPFNKSKKETQNIIKYKGKHFFLLSLKIKYTMQLKYLYYSLSRIFKIL